MKNIAVLLFGLLISFHVFAQNNVGTKIKLPLLDKSPMDMAYFPNEYPMLRSQDKANEPLIARVIYSRPQKNNRSVFGELVEYNSIWRLGANEATEIEFFRDVKIGGKKLAKGRYTMYAIPTEQKWTVIFNKDTDIWGAFKYDSKKDALRIDLRTQKTTEPVEAFSMDFMKSSNGTDLTVSWDTVKVTVPIITK